MAQYGTTDRCTGGTASAIGYSGTNVSANAVADDGNTTYWYVLDEGSTPWWKYDLVTSWKISKLIMQCKNIVAKCGVKNFNVQGSGDNSNWTTLTTDITVDNESEQTFTWTNNITYRYIKINVTDNWDAQTNRALIGEVQLFEGIYPVGSVGAGSPMMI